jgi:hypothetical protein
VVDEWLAWMPSRDLELSRTPGRDATAHVRGRSYYSHQHEQISKLVVTSHPRPAVRLLHIANPFPPTRIRIHTMRPLALHLTTLQCIIHKLHSSRLTEIAVVDVATHPLIACRKKPSIPAIGRPCFDAIRTRRTRVDVYDCSNLLTPCCSWRRLCMKERGPETVGEMGRVLHPICAKAEIRSFCRQSFLSFPISVVRHASTRCEECGVSAGIFPFLALDSMRSWCRQNVACASSTSFSVRLP